MPVPSKDAGSKVYDGVIKKILILILLTGCTINVYIYDKSKNKTVQQQFGIGNKNIIDTTKKK